MEEGAFTCDDIRALNRIVLVVAKNWLVVQLKRGSGPSASIRNPHNVLCVYMKTDQYV